MATEKKVKKDASTSSYISKDKALKFGDAIDKLLSTKPIKKKKKNTKKG